MAFPNRDPKKVEESRTGIIPGDPAAMESARTGIYPADPAKVAADRAAHGVGPDSPPKGDPFTLAFFRNRGKGRRR